MKKIILLLLFIISAQSFLHSQSPVVQAVINQTNIDSLVYFVKELSGEVQTIIGGSPYTIVSRNKSNPSNDKAADYIKQKLSSYGLTTFDQWFSATGRNVYGVKTGTQYPNKKYMICAHYDDMPTGTTAPGADDNGSGTAAVIEAARIFSQYSSKYTIIFALWDEEEQGLVGSAYYALQAHNAGDSIMGVINMDMIAWDNDNDGVGEIHIRNYGNSNALKDTMVQVNTTYSLGVTPSIQNPGTTASDQASFWNNGYGALLLIEEYYGGDFNAYYHTVNDKLMYFNQSYFLKMSKLAFGTVATLAKLEATFSYTVSIFDGWNMVSIPGLHPFNQNVITWWPGKDPATPVFKFQAGYQPVTTVVPGMGYWLKHNGDSVYSIEGILIVPHNPIPAALGWNLIGGYEEIVPTAGITTTPPGLQTGSVFKFLDSTYVIANELEPGYGYWIKLTGAGSINIPSVFAGLTKTAAGPSTERLGKITVTDNVNKGFTLYAANDKTDLAQFDLPPLPPQGMFDIRFSSQRYAERINNGMHEIEMRGVQYPVRIRADGTGIILSDETGREIGRLNSGEEITLNTAVYKLMVSENITPAVYSLGQNYPNPFNPVTNISYSIPSASKVSIRIFDILGNEIITLVNEEKPAGKYELTWNASALPSGAYFYQITAGSYIETKKMILMK